MSAWKKPKVHLPTRPVRIATSNDELNLIDGAVRNLRCLTEVSDSLIDDWIHKGAKAEFLVYPDKAKRAELRGLVREQLK